MDTELGTAEVEKARQYLAKIIGDQFTRSPLVGEVEPHLSEFARLDLPEDSRIIERWISDLDLKAYKGKGKLLYDQTGTPRPDRALLEELGLTHRNYEMLSAQGSAYEIGNSMFCAYRIKAGCVKDLEQ